MKAVLVNNYDLLEILDLLEQELGNAPTQHLWGYPALAHYEIGVDILPFRGNKFLKKVGEKLKLFGDLDQQFRLLLNCHRYDVIYSAHYLTTTLLSFLSILGLLKKPIVAIGYQAPRTKSFHWRLFVKTFIEGNNKILCLSESLLKDLEEFGIPRQKLDVIEWGTDLRFYRPAEWDEMQPEKMSENLSDTASVERFILSPGKSYRDYPTLVKAFATLDCDLTICGAGQLNLKQLQRQTFGNAIEPLPDNVSIVQEMLDWRDFIRLYQQAYAVAIPVIEEETRFKNAIGLTVLTEAMAMGKAIVMTRSDYVGVDLEREGIGLWVEQGDVDGWRRAIAHLLDNPAETREMGRRARLLAEKRFNLEQFSKKLADSLWQAHNARSSAQLQTPPSRRAVLR
jgi:glycosyltransferase involved in cell wall biosynthesis